MPLLAPSNEAGASGEFELAVLILGGFLSPANAAGGPNSAIQQAINSANRVVVMKKFPQVIIITNTTPQARSPQPCNNPARFAVYVLDPRQKPGEPRTAMNMKYFRNFAFLSGLLLTTVTARAQALAPQIADGGGWKTTFFVVNNDNTAHPYSITFSAENGAALTIPLADGTLS